MQAIILAAGMGKRLKHLTEHNTKCMVQVNKITLIERMLKQLDDLNLSRIVIVYGFKGDELKKFISTLGVRTPIVYVENDIYYKTNNIYSLFLSRQYLLEDDTLLLESDLIFEPSLLNKLIQDPYPSLALVAKYESWMDGTVVTIDDQNNITSFRNKDEFVYANIKDYYKTVNIYKFSQSFSNSHYVPFLEAYSKALGDNEYYEQVLKVITLLDKPEIKASVLSDEAWYEIDDLQDLDIAESIFTETNEEKLNKIQKRYGGYWRYPKLIDFCYLVNPFYPSQRLLDEIKANFERLIRDYPSGLDVNNLLVAKYYGIRKECVLVGNGAADLIRALLSVLDGNVGIVLPTFEEYPSRVIKGNVISFIPDNKNFSYDADSLVAFYEGKDIDALLLINPDNPSGNYIMKKDVLRLAKWAEEKGIRFIVDESFVDFVDLEENTSLLDEDILDQYPQMIVIKSISKSFGVPGLRLGLLATSDIDIVKKTRAEVAIWNINSFAEFYLQIFEKYKSEYESAANEFKKVRADYITKLQEIKNLKVIPSQANYVLCELLNGYKAKDLTRDLLDQYNVLIKDLSNKNGINGEYIRIAVKRIEENDVLINAMKRLLYN